MPPLTRQLVPMIPRKRDGSVSDKSAPLGTFTRLENYVQDKTGRYRKRNGAARLGALASGSGGFCATRNGELVVSDGTSIYAWNPAAQEFVNRGRVKSYVPRVQTYAQVTNEIDVVHVPDFGLTFHFYASFAATANSAIHYSVVNADGGYVVKDGTIAAGVGVNYRGVRAVRSDNAVLVFYLEDGSGNEHLYVKKIGAGTPATVSAAVQVDSDATGVQFFDVRARTPRIDRGYSTDIDIVWRPVASLRTLRLRRWDPSTMALRPFSLDILPASITWDINIGVNWIDTPNYVGNVVVSTQSNSGGVRLVYCDDDFVTFGGSINIDTTATAEWRAVTGFAAPLTPTPGFYVLAERIDATTATHSRVIQFFVNANTLAVSTIRTLWGAQLASRAWTDANEELNPTAVDAGYACVGFPSSEQGLAGVYDWTNGRFVTRMIENVWFSTVFAWELYGSCLAGVAKKADRSIIAALRQKTSAATVGTIGLAVAIAQIELDSAAAVGMPKTAADTLYVPGGIVRAYDGAVFVEAGFHYYPERPVTAGAPGAGGLAAGTYRMRATYVWTDANGREHESAPSDSVSFTVGAAASQAFNIQTYRWTDRTNVKIRLWRTTVNPTVDPDYYLENETNNVTTANTVTMTCTLVDATLTAQRSLYVRGDESVLVNIPPPAATVLEVYNSRLWAIDAQSRRYVWASKVFEEGFGIAWNDDVLILALETAGDIEALGSLGDRLLILKRETIHAVWGDGPDNTGNGAFGTPWEFADKFGTDSPIVEKTPLGVLFRATGDKGWRVANSQLAVQNVGADVEDLTGLTPTAITADQNLIRVCHRDGTTLVFDTEQGCWYVHTNQRVTGACLYEGRWTYIDTNGVVRYEAEGVYHDDGVPVVPAWETTWVAFASIGGHQRTYSIVLTGARLGIHRLKMHAELNYGAREIGWMFDPQSGEDAEEFASSLGFGVGVYGGQDEDGRSQYEFRLKVHDQRANALKLRCEEYFPDESITAGYAFEAVSFEVGLLPGKGRHPNAYRKPQT